MISQSPLKASLDRRAKVKERRVASAFAAGPPTVSAGVARSAFAHSVSIFCSLTDIDFAPARTWRDNPDPARAVVVGGQRGISNPGWFCEVRGSRPNQPVRNSSFPAPQPVTGRLLSFPSSRTAVAVCVCVRHLFHNCIVSIHIHFGLLPCAYFASTLLCPSFACATLAARDLWRRLDWSDDCGKLSASRATVGSA